MRLRRRSLMNQGRLCGLRASMVAQLLSVCIVALCLVFAGGCPSKPSQESSQPSATSSPSSTTNNQQPATKNEQRATNNQQSATIAYRYKVVRTYPHDPRAFTQGLEYEDGVLYESTGLYGQSALIKRNLETGEVLKIERLPRKYFGEGITVFRDRIIQLTWKSQTGFVYDKNTFRLLREFSYRGEGWGLTHDATHLIMSDGTATLRFLDPNTFAEVRRLTVRDNGRPINDLNELEFIPDANAHAAQASWRGRPALVSRGHLGLASPSDDASIESEGQGQDALATQETPPAKSSHGSIFANIWQSDTIVVIDPDTGRVTGRLDLSALYPRPYGSEAVLNGIAFLPQSRHLLITGKLWPNLYEIEVVREPRGVGE